MSYEANYESKPAAASAPPPDATAAASPSKSTSPLVDLLGPTLIKNGQEVATATALAAKKAVGIYFSAHW